MLGIVNSCSELVVLLPRKNSKWRQICNHILNSASALSDLIKTSFSKDTVRLLLKINCKFELL